MKSSELIINPDGSVYHLSLKPGEVATTIITVGDQDRVSEVSKHFDSIEFKKANREFVTHTGVIGSKRLTVMSTGIGTDNIDIVLNELHSLFNIDFETGEAKANRQNLNFVRLGTSGAISLDTPINSILASEAAIGYDSLMHFYKNDFSKTQISALMDTNPSLKELPTPYFVEGSAELLEHFKGTYERKGITITAPGFYAPQGRAVNAPIQVSDFLLRLGQSKINQTPITNLEMETAGIYGLSSLLGHRAISISAILANRISGEFSKDPAKIVATMIENSLEKIIELR